jgi:hypothetical protein
MFHVLLVHGIVEPARLDIDEHHSIKKICIIARWGGRSSVERV